MATPKAKSPPRKRKTAGIRPSTTGMGLSAWKNLQVRSIEHTVASLWLFKSAIGQLCGTYFFRGHSKQDSREATTAAGVPERTGVQWKTEQFLPICLRKTAPKWQFSCITKKTKWPGAILCWGSRGKAVLGPERVKVFLTNQWQQLIKKKIWKSCLDDSWPCKYGFLTAATG